MSTGHYTIPTRVYLTSEQRAKLTTIVRDHAVDVADLLTELLITFLDHLPESEQKEWLEAEPEQGNERATEVRRRRSELRRLRLRLNEPANPPPPWFVTYIKQLERELERLEQEHEP